MCTPLSLALLACSSLLPSASACNASLGPVRNLRVGQREDWFKYTPSIPDQEEIRGQIRADFSTHLQLKDFESETYPYKAFYKANFGGDDKLDIGQDVGAVLREKFDLLWRKAYDSCRRAFDLAQERKSADVYLVALKDLLYTDLLDLQEEVEELTKQKLQPFDRQINLDGLDKMAKKILKLLTFDRKYRGPMGIFAQPRSSNQKLNSRLPTHRPPELVLARNPSSQPPEPPSNTRPPLRPPPPRHQGTEKGQKEQAAASVGINKLYNEIFSNLRSYWT